MLIRTATEADRPALLALQLASWRSAYEGLLPVAYLGKPVEADLAAAWARPFTDADIRLVAEQDGRPVGLVVLIEKNGAPYVDNLHVAPDVKGQGVGAALMRATAARLAARGDDRMWLTVITENRDATAFYERMGGIAHAPVADELFGNPITSREVHWPSLAPLL